MELQDLFYKWVPVWIRLPVLFLFFFVLLTANGVYLGNATDMCSGLGVYPEPFTEAYNAVYIGMGLGLMVEWRLKLRFSGRTLLLWGFVLLLLMNMLNMLTSDPSVIVLACLVLGFTKMTALIEVYIIWLVIWSKKMDTSRLYPFVYFTALSGIYFITWLTTRIALTYNWRYAYIVILLLVLLCLLCALFFVEGHPLRRPLPLYQMDVPGLALLALFLLLLNYVAIYGKTENWWHSAKIQAATCLLPVLLFGFLRRELQLKRPLLSFNKFKKSSFLIGLLFFFLLGIFLPSSIQGLFTTAILDFENIRNAELNLYLIPGVALAAVICFIWYYHKLNAEVMLFLGFAAFVGYYYILYTHLATGLGMNDFWIMSILKGFGVATLYIVIGLYTTAGFPLQQVLTAAGVMIIVRSFLGSGIISGLYSYLLYAGRIRHLNILAGSRTADAGYLSKPSGYIRQINIQATLAASKELCGYIIMAGLMILAVIVFRHFIRRLLHQHKNGRV